MQHSKGTCRELNLKMEKERLPESIEKKIEELNLELAPIKNERDKLNSEATDWAKKRNAVHEQIRKLRTEASGIKDKRDELNQKVKELKSLREQAKTKRKEKHDEFSKLREKMKTLLEKKPSPNLHAIQEEIENIEWKIQTTPFSVKEEEELINKVRHLETQRNILKRLQELNSTLIELQTEERALATGAKVHHEKLSELAEQSQKLHEQRLEILQHVRNLKVEADSAHQKYAEYRKKADELHQRYIELLQKITELKQKQRKVDKKKQAKRQKQLLEDTRKKTLKKIKRGEKLTWEEFKLLAEQEDSSEKSS